MTPDPLERLAAGFARACDARPAEVADHVFSVGGAPVYAHIAGRGVASILQGALLPVSAGRSGLTLQLWDEEATGVAPARGAEAQVALVRSAGPDELLGIWAGGRFLRYSGPHFDIRLDREAARAVGWLRSARLLSSWHRARPLQTLFVLWLATRGAATVHAAMVAREEAGVLLPGPAHSGKSTVAAACAEAGFRLLGDETIAVDTRGARAAGHCIHAALKLRGVGLERHPGLVGHAHALGPPWQDDVVVLVNEAFPEQTAATADVRALAFPAVSSAVSTSFAPMGSGEAMRVLTGCLLPVEPANLLPAFAVAEALVERVPAYRVQLGTATGRIPVALDELLTRLSEATAVA